MNEKKPEASLNLRFSWELVTWALKFTLLPSMIVQALMKRNWHLLKSPQLSTSLSLHPHPENIFRFQSLRHICRLNHAKHNRAQAAEISWHEQSPDNKKSGKSPYQNKINFLKANIWALFSNYSIRSKGLSSG